MGGRRARIGAARTAEEGSAHYRSAWRAQLRRSPAVLVLLVAVAVFLAMAERHGGFLGTDWYPPALFVLGLFVVALVSMPPPRRSPRLVVAAVLLLGLYAALSYLSIGWADQRADAWDGANRTALYAVTFALFALWALRGAAAATVLGALGLGVAALGLVELLRVNGAPDPSPFFSGGRFAAPVGYANANAALWSLGLWPCLALAVRREVAPALRGTFLGAAMLLAGLALMGQSRGWLFSIPLVAIVFLVLAPARTRAALGLIAVAGGTFFMRGPLVEVYRAIEADPGGAHAAAVLAQASRTLILAAAALAVLWALVAAADARLEVSPRHARLGGRALLLAGGAASVAGLLLWTGQGGDPVRAVASGWQEFRHTTEPRQGPTHLGGGFGSNRYDFWRVALGVFRERPAVGAGAENFQQDYLERRRSDETPRYPHSLAFRVLAETGLVGALLLAAALVAALAAARGAILRRSGLGAAVAAGASTTFVYFFVHGSVDWFWELAGLGAAAFAMLGLAAAFPGPAPPDDRGRRSRRLRWKTRAALAAGTCVLALSFAAPWVAERHADTAIRIWRIRPEEALAYLDRAAGLNPLSSRPQLLSGTISLRLGRVQRAEHDFRVALERDPRGDYAALELGAIASEQGRRDALPLIALAARLNPRDEVIADALREVREGRRLRVAAINAELLRRAREFSDEPVVRVVR